MRLVHNSPPLLYDRCLLRASDVVLGVLQEGKQSFVAGLDTESPIDSRCLLFLLLDISLLLVLFSFL